MEHVIDAKGKIVGRLASEVASLLIGKNKATYRPEKVAPMKVKVFNSDLVIITGKKASQKLYRRHSGHIGNLKEESFSSLLQRDSRQIIKYAVSGMLPKNKLRRVFLKNVLIYKKELPAK